MIRLILACLSLFAASTAKAVTCQDVTFSETSFTVCEVSAAEDLRLFHADDTGEIYGGFAPIEADVGALSFAMNAGMYHDDRSPVGLYQEAGNIKRSIVLSAGPGNFGLLPNGVLCIRDGEIKVIESSQFSQETCRDATQSGPMLVIDGDLHPRFIPNGTSKFIRNGVGTSNDGQTAYFAISNAPVNFHTFGRFFKDHLELDQALYFDGNVSRLYAPQLSRDDIGRRLGPIVGVVAQ